MVCRSDHDKCASGHKKVIMKLQLYILHMEHRGTKMMELPLNDKSPDKLLLMSSNSSAKSFFVLIRIIQSRSGIII